MMCWLAGCFLLAFKSVLTSRFKQVECFGQSNRKFPVVESEALAQPLW